MRPGPVVKQAARGSGVGARFSPGPVGPETTAGPESGLTRAGGVQGREWQGPQGVPQPAQVALPGPGSAARRALSSRGDWPAPALRWPVDNKTNALLTDCRALNPPGRHDDVSANRLLNS